MKQYRALLPLLLLYIAFKLPAQTLHLSNLGINDGLSQSMVNCMLQDSRGYMWIGTGDGLNRYDGTQCVVYKNRINDAFSISNNTIRSLMEDRLGNVWIGTDAGLNRFDRTTNRFYNVLPGAHGITTLCVDADSLLWMLVHGKGLACYNMHTQKLKLFYGKKGEGIYANLGAYKCVKMADSNVYLIAGNMGVIRFMPDWEHPQCTEDLRFKEVFANDPLNEIVDNGKELWLSAVAKTVRYEKETGRMTSYSNMDHVCIDNKGKVWTSTFAGDVFTFDQGRQQFVKKAFDRQLSSIKCLYADSNGNMWIGTDGNGAYICSPSRNKFAWYNTASEFTNTPQRLGGDFIRRFQQDNQGRIWVGTYKHGVNIVDVRTNSLFTIHNPWLARQTVHALYNDGKQMWIGTEEGLYTCNLHTYAIAPVNAGIPRNTIVYNITKLRNGRMVIGTLSGAFIAKDNTHSAFERLAGILSKTIQVYEDRNGKLWIATAYYTYSTVPPYKEKKREAISPEGREILDFSSKTFAEDHNGVLWIGGKKGLVRYDQQTGLQQLFTEQDGLPDAMVYSILPDAQHRLWISSNKGLSCFDPATNRFVNYTIDDGLQSNEFNSGAFYKDDKGLMYFGGVCGFNVFDPMHIALNANKPIVNLTGVKIFDIDYGTGTDYSVLKEINLKPSENTVSFEFAAMDFSNPDKNQYAYMLEGADEDWAGAGTRRFARYANLSPGAYTFKVKAANNDGIWSEPYTLLHINVAAPWWQRWWAIAAMLAIVGSIVYWGVRYTFRQKLEKQLREMEKLHAVNLERTRISKDMHDDLGSGLSRIAVMSELLKQQSKQDKNEQVEKISKTASDLIDNMSHIIWAMNPENDHISNLLAYIREHAVEFLESCGLHCELHFPEQAPETMLTQEARRNIFLVVKESLNNIVKHAAARHVCIVVNITNDKLTLTVKDDGKGFDPEMNKRNGNGLRNMAKRMEQVKGSYSIISELGRGTATIITVDTNTHLM